MDLRLIVRPIVLSAVTVLLLRPASGQTETFRVATYNLENYLVRATESRTPKPEAAKAQIVTNLVAIHPDVLAVQEIGQISALKDLQAHLKSAGLNLPNWEWVAGWDTNIHVAVLSRFPIIARHPHTNESYLLSGRRLHVSRGFAEVDIRVATNYTFTLFTAHLKSKRRIAVADESEMRAEEAKLLRRVIDERLAANPDANFLVCGDFNDFYNSTPVKLVVGRGRSALTDTRPAEQNGDDQPNPRNPRWFPRNVAWTHLYGAEDTYGRIDYILLSPGMTPEWERQGTYALTLANWGIGSDHRPIVATFDVGDR